MRKIKAWMFIIALLVGLVTGTIGFMLVGAVIYLGFHMMIREAEFKYGCGFLGFLLAIMVIAAVMAKFLL